jgi:hypothetical protein
MFAGAEILANFDKRLGLANACTNADWIAQIAQKSMKEPANCTFYHALFVGDFCALAWAVCVHGAKSAELAISAHRMTTQGLNFPVMASNKRISSVQHVTQALGIARYAYEGLNGEIYDRCFQVLDGLLAIGPKSKGFTNPERQLELSMLA